MLKMSCLSPDENNRLFGRLKPNLVQSSVLDMIWELNILWYLGQFDRQFKLILL